MILYNEEAEQIVLGTILQNSNLYLDISEILKLEDFFLESHRVIYGQISKEIDKQNKPDLLLVITRLKESNLLEKVGNRSYLTELATMASPYGVHTYANDIKSLSLRRQLLNNLKSIEISAADPSVTIEKLLGDTEQAIFKVTDRHSNYNVQHVKEIKSEFDQLIIKLATVQDGLSGLATGFKGFDQKTAGLKGGQMIVLAARPGVGKTTFALNIAKNIVTQSKKAVLLFSLEMTRLELFNRIVAAQATINQSLLSRGGLNKRHILKITQAVNILYQSNLYIDDSADLSVWDFKTRSRRLAAILKQSNIELGLIIVDYLQLMTDKNVKDNRQQEVSNISRNLKLISKELNVPIIALSQMNRSIESRGKDPRPQLADLRESGAIEQDADIVMFLHREGMHKKEEDADEDDKTAELIIAKHRAGPSGSIKLVFLKDQSLFLDIAVLDDEQQGSPISGPLPDYDE